MPIHYDETTIWLCIPHSMDEVLSFIKTSGLYPAYLKELVRHELIQSTPVLETTSTQHRLDELQQGLSDPKALVSQARQAGLSDEEFLRHAAYLIRFRDWCSETFMSISDSLYIKYKLQLTKVAYTALRSKNKGLVMETYHQLSAQEIAFEELYIKALLSEDSVDPSHTPLTPVAELLDDVASVLLPMEIKAISFPRSIQGTWVIFRLESRDEPTLNDELRKQLCLIEGQARLEQAYRQKLTGNYNQEDQ